MNFHGYVFQAQINSSVYKVVNAIGNVYACKIISKLNCHLVFDSVLGTCPIEAHIIFTFKHCSIISFIDLFHDHADYYLVTEYHGFINMLHPPITDLFQFIQDNGPLTESQARHIMLQIVNALQFLWQHRYVHGDIKEENILIDNQLNIKLIDFGSASRVPVGQLCDKIVGTAQYLAPELIQSQKFHADLVDVWALGCVFYAMLFDAMPFSDFEEAIHAKYTTDAVQISAQAKCLLAGMLEPVPSRRYTLVDILDSAWFK